MGRKEAWRSRPPCAAGRACGARCCGVRVGAALTTPRPASIARLGGRPECRRRRGGAGCFGFPGRPASRAEARLVPAAAGAGTEDPETGWVGKGRSANSQYRRSRTRWSRRRSSWCWSHCSRRISNRSPIRSHPGGALMRRSLSSGRSRTSQRRAGHQGNGADRTSTGSIPTYRRVGRPAASTDLASSADRLRGCGTQPGDRLAAPVYVQLLQDVVHVILDGGQLDS